MTIYIDKKLWHNRPDITLLQRDTKDWTLIDIAVPADQNIIETEEAKVERYKDLVLDCEQSHFFPQITRAKGRKIYAN